MAEKMTKAQRELLDELPTHVVPEYKPAQALIRMGLAKWHDSWSTMLVLTEDGKVRRALDEASHG